jgi:hypothetical protein
MTHITVKDPLDIINIRLADVQNKISVLLMVEQEKKDFYEH